ncbi:hypothetical protein D3C79_921580 [compost metagenome]
MAGLGALTQVSIFQFDKVTHMGLGIQHAARAQARERAGIATLAHHGAFNMAVGLDHHAFAQGAVLDHAVRPNLNVVLDHDLAFEDDVDIDQHIATNGHFTTHVETSRVTQGHTLCHQSSAFAQLIVALEFG